MSNKVVNLDEVSASGRPFLKSGTYYVRCTECKQGKSRKGNQMLTFKYEIVSPDTVTDADGKEVKITGLSLSDWIVLGDTGLPRLKGLHKALSLPMTVDLENMPVKQYVGKALRVSLSTEASTQMDDNTNEPMVDDEGTPIIMNNYRIGRFLGADLDHTIASEDVAF